MGLMVLSACTKKDDKAAGQKEELPMVKVETVYDEDVAQVSEYTAAPVFMDDKAKCYHQWLVEFKRMPNSIEAFRTLLDNHLQELNSDYEAKRYHNVTLQKLELVVAREGLFNDWLKSKGKLGGQHKIPRLSNSRKNIDELLGMNRQEKE